MSAIQVVKIGGEVIDNPRELAAFLDLFAALPGRKILVHGGGKEATRMSAAMGIEARMVDGRRVTDARTLEIVTMVYAGLINKRIVAMLQARGCDAIGLTGADGNAIPATRRPAEPIDYGFVGDIDPTKIDSAFISTLLEAGKVPVFCAICHDRHGSLLNCNADSVAAAVAIAASSIGPAALAFCFDKAGVMADVDDPSSVIPRVDESQVSALREKGIVAKGMVPKLHNALCAAHAGVSPVRICNAAALGCGAGTIVEAP